MRFIWFLILFQLLENVHDVDSLRMVRPKIPRPISKCLPGCNCISKRWSRYRIVDCSYRSLTKIPEGRLGVNDMLLLNGNKIKNISHFDFDHLDNLYGLDLRDNLLSIVPSAVFLKLINLKTLYLTTHNLHHFAFHGLQQLETLRIEGADLLNELNVALLKPLTNTLTNLTISNTKIEKISKHAIAGMKHLRILDLSNNQISFIADDAFDGTTALNTIRLSNNKLNTFPMNFKKNHMIRNIDVSSNLINNLTNEAFDGMTSLRTLILTDNKINKLKPRLFDRVNQLSHVSLRKNQLTEVPEALVPEKCNSLMFLDLHSNKIKKLKLITNKDCTSVTSLNLGNNDLIALNVTAMKRLQTLDISNNCRLNFSTETASRYLRKIDLSFCCLNDTLPHYFSQFSKYSNIDQLNLHGNNFKTFHSKFTILNLNISSNQLEQINFTFSSYQRHNNFDLSNNKLTTIQYHPRNTYFKTIYIASLNLRNNKFSIFDGSWIRNLRELDLSFNNLESLDDISINQRLNRFPSWMIHLKVTGNKITKIKNSVLTTMKMLQTLDLSQNKITNVEEKSFKNLWYLRHLNLSYNELTELPVAVADLEILRTIDASHNKLRHISNDILNKMSKLEQIVLNNNKLESLPIHLSTFTVTYRKSIVLKVQRNPLQCSCNLTTMLSYYQNIQPFGECYENEYTVQLINKLLSVEDLINSGCDLCPMNPCQYRGDCTSISTGFKCSCHLGFSGRLCGVSSVDCFGDKCKVCAKNPCRNGGTCIENENRKDYNCRCHRDYKGKNCESCAGDRCLKLLNNTSSGKSQSGNIAIAVVAVLLVGIIITLVLLVRKYGLCKRDLRVDRLELVKDFD